MISKTLTQQQSEGANNMTYTEQIAERILSCNPTDTLGLSLADYARLVSGDLMLPPKRLEDIADRLGVSFAWLIGEET